MNECLIGPVLTMGGMFVAYACAFLSYLYLVFTDPAYNRNGDFTPVVVAYAFLIGLQIANCFTTPLSSGIDTIFVAMAWDPEVLMREHADLYQRMIQVYPHVQQVCRRLGPFDVIALTILCRRFTRDQARFIVSSNNSTHGSRLRIREVLKRECFRHSFWLV